jgi:hypothetical protein
MKEKCVLMKYFLPGLIFIGGSLWLPAQTVEYLNANNVNAGIGIGGNLFTTTTPTSIWDLFEIPAGSGKREIYTAALWMSAIDPGGNLHCAANQYFDYGNDYFDGPVSSTYNSGYDNYYKRVFKVTQLQLYNFGLLSFPATSAQVDPAIKYWPGKGNACVLNDYGVSIDAPLAPFVDLNNNGIYEPLLGEYPAVVGDQNIFFVFNDIRSLHTETNGEPLGVEIRGLASGFVDPYQDIPSYNTPLNNTVFVQYQIENKSQTTYSDYKLGLWVDPDIGCFENDYVGCDTNRSMMIAYNGTANDPDCAPENGYGSTSIALGVQMLDQRMGVFGYFTSDGGGGNTIGFTAGIYANYLHGYWADGTPFELGRTGYNSGGSITKFIFPGDPTDSTGWSEPTAHLVPGDRRMFGATGFSTFSPGEVKYFDIGFTSAYDITGSNNLSIVDSLKESADIIRRFYNEDIIPYQQVSGISQISPTSQLIVSLYPNPANNQVAVACTNDIQTVQLLDIEGRTLFAKTVDARKVVIPVSALARGAYLVNVVSGSTSVVKKLVVE